MERQMLYLFLLKILRRVRFKWHAVVAHAFLAVSTHFFISPPRDLAILLIQMIVELRLYYDFPRTLDRSMRVCVFKRHRREVFSG